MDNYNFDSINFDDINLSNDFDKIKTPVSTNKSVSTEKEVIVNIAEEYVGFDNNVATIDVHSAVTKLKTIGNELKELFFEREEVIDNALRALIVGQSMLLLGPPGTGKSAITSELCSRINGSTYFQWLLNRTSDPAEILGPYSLKGMEEDKFIRITTGKLPEAQIAFLDEIFKCNEPTLNILLSLINEKIFYNDGVATPVPLISLFAASNETPDDESLDALYDRLIFRMWVDYIQGKDNKIKMFKSYVDKRNNTSNNVKTTIDLEELLAIQEATKNVKIENSILKTFINLLNNLKKHNIVVSDRRQNECLKIMQGNALLQGRNTVTSNDLEALIFVLWKDKDDIAIIREEIDKLVNVLSIEIKEIRNKYKQIEDDINAENDPTARCRKAIEARSSLESLKKKLTTAINKASKEGIDTADAEALRNELVQYNQKIMEESLGAKLSNGKLV